MAYQGEILKKTRFLDLPKRDGRLDAAAKAEIGHGKFRVARIGSSAADDISYADDCGFPHAVINEGAIAGFHVANGAQSLGIPDAVPDRVALPFELLDGVCLGIGFCEKITVTTQDV